MINIKLDGGYRIYNQDELSVILAKTYVVANPKSKNAGQEKEKVLGYFANLRQALDGYVNRRMMDGETELSGDAEKIVEALEKLRGAIKAACGGAK